MKKITIYSTPTCPYCRMEKELLTQKGVKFTDINVAADEAKAQEMIEKSGQMGVPVTVIADEKGQEEIIVGFDQRRLVASLGL